MLIDIGKIDPKLLRKQAELVSMLTDPGTVLTDRQCELLEGVWNLLGAIRDQVDPPKEAKAVAPEVLTVQISLDGGLVDVWDVPAGVKVILRDYDAASDSERDDLLDYARNGMLKENETGIEYVEFVTEGRTP